MNFHGSALAFPVRPDVRGTLAVVSDPAAIAAQEITALLLTKKGERKMLPDLGLSDFVFSVLDAGLAARIAAEAEEQIKRYARSVGFVRVTGGSMVNNAFSPQLTGEAHTAAIRVEYTVRGANTPYNMTHPVWSLRDDFRRSDGG